MLYKRIVRFTDELDFLLHFAFLAMKSNQIPQSENSIYKVWKTGKNLMVYTSVSCVLVALRHVRAIGGTVIST